MTLSTTPDRFRALIVNADDFGLSAGVNAGVIAAHRAGLETWRQYAAARRLELYCALKAIQAQPQQYIAYNIADQESAVSISKVQLVCATCGPVRIGHEVRGDRKVRVCKKCGTTLDKT